MWFCCPLCSLQRCNLNKPVFEALGSLLRSGSSLLKSLSVGLNKVGDQGVKHLWEAVAHPNCLLEELEWVQPLLQNIFITALHQQHHAHICVLGFLSVEMTRLTDSCVEELCAALRATKTLRNLGLSNNSLTDASAAALVQSAQQSQNLQEMKYASSPLVNYKPPLS